VQWERDAFAALYEARTRWTCPKSKYPAECIVFSKDRALFVDFSIVKNATTVY